MSNILDPALPYGQVPEPPHLSMWCYRGPPPRLVQMIAHLYGKWKVICNCDLHSLTMRVLCIDDLLTQLMESFENNRLCRVNKLCIYR